MDKVHIRPVAPEIMLLDDQPDSTEGGVAVVDRLYMCRHMDYLVVRAEGEDLGFGAGDVVILSRPDAGRRIVLDGTTYRLVHQEDVIAIKEYKNA